MASVRSFSVRGRALLGTSGLIIVVFAFAAVATAYRALAQRRAAGGLHTQRGSYLFTASGFNIVDGIPQPKAILEAIDFDGHGTLEVPAVTVSINGNVSQSAGGVGVYSLDEECRGTVAFTPGPSFNIFTDRNGQQAHMIQTNPNTVFQGTVTKLPGAGGGRND